MECHYRNWNITGHSDKGQRGTDTKNTQEGGQGKWKRMGTQLKQKDVIGEAKLNITHTRRGADKIKEEKRHRESESEGERLRQHERELGMNKN